jgi:hypothetical protein
VTNAQEQIRVEAVENPVARKTTYGWLTNRLVAEMPCGHSVALYSVPGWYFGKYGIAWDRGKWEPSGMISAGLTVEQIVKFLLLGGFMLPEDQVKTAVETLLATASLLGYEI